MAVLPKLFANRAVSQTGSWSPTTPETISNGVLTPSADSIVSGSNSTAVLNWDLGAMPSNFAKMTTFNYSVRYGITGLNDDTLFMYFRIFKNDGTTPLTNEMLVVQRTSSIGLTNILNVAFTGLDTAATKFDWDTAIWQVRTAFTQNMAKDASAWQLNEVEFNGTYQSKPSTVLNSPSDVATGVAVTPTLSFTGIDPDGDSVGYNVEIDTANTFLSGAFEFDRPVLINGHASYVGMTSVAVNSSGLFVAVGYNVIAHPHYATSTDGINWTTPALMNGSTAYALMHSITVNSAGLFVAVGRDNVSYHIFATSTDGTNWTTPARMSNQSSNGVMYSVAVNSSGLFVAVGENNSYVSQYSTSTNGTNWTTPAFINGTTVLNRLHAITVNSAGLFVAVGVNQFNHPVFATSANGSTWTTPALMNGTSTHNLMKSVAVNSSGLFVAIGRDINLSSVFATSTDGTNWTTPALLNGSTVNCTMNTIAVNSSGLFITIGQDSNRVFLFATSTDGTNWTTPARINGTIDIGYLNGITVNSAGLFVAVGYSDTDVYPIVTNYAKRALISKYSVTDAGFPAGQPYASGVQQSYTVQSALTENTTYYWRARAIDPSGTNTYGAWSSIRSFTTAGGAAIYNGVLKMWNGSAWVKAKLKRWNGSAWVATTLKRWDGSEWKDTDTTGI